MPATESAAATASALIVRGLLPRRNGAGRRARVRARGSQRPMRSASRSSPASLPDPPVHLRRSPTPNSGQSHDAESLSVVSKANFTEKVDLQ
jgi:hypothetical protein